MSWLRGRYLHTAQAHIDVSLRKREGDTHLEAHERASPRLRRLAVLGDRLEKSGCCDADEVSWGRRVGQSWSGAVVVSPVHGRT